MLWTRVFFPCFIYKKSRFARWGPRTPRHHSGDFPIPPFCRGSRAIMCDLLQQLAKNPPTSSTWPLPLLKLRRQVISLQVSVKFLSWLSRWCFKMVPVSACQLKNYGSRSLGKEKYKLRLPKTYKLYVKHCVYCISNHITRIYLTDFVMRILVAYFLTAILTLFYIFEGTIQPIKCLLN